MCVHISVIVQHVSVQGRPKKRFSFGAFDFKNSRFFATCMETYQRFWTSEHEFYLNAGGSESFFKAQTIQKEKSDLEVSTLADTVLLSDW